MRIQVYLSLGILVGAQNLGSIANAQESQLPVDVEIVKRAADDAVNQSNRRVGYPLPVPLNQDGLPPSADLEYEGWNPAVENSYSCPSVSQKETSKTDKTDTYVIETQVEPIEPIPSEIC